MAASGQLTRPLAHTPTSSRARYRRAGQTIRTSVPMPSSTGRT